MKYFLLISTIIFISACHSNPDHLKPAGWIFKQMPQDAPANFQKAWKDGCESGMASMTNSVYAKFYKFEQDPLLRKDPVYYKVWKDTFTFCRHYAYGGLRQADARRSLLNKRWSVLLGSDGNIFEKGLLQMWGPGGSTMLFNNFGKVGGHTTFNETGVLNAMDFSGDVPKLGIGTSSGGLTWDWRPEQDLGFFSDTTIDLPMLQTPTLQVPTLQVPTLRH